MDDIEIEGYMDLGPLEASDVAREMTGSPKINAMGYCIGGTLLTLTLATLVATGDDRFNVASFMVSMQDFDRVGDTAVFMDEPAIDLIEQQMMERGCHHTPPRRCNRTVYEVSAEIGDPRAPRKRHLMDLYARRRPRMSLVLQPFLPFPHSCQGPSPHQQGRDARMIEQCFGGIDVSQDRLDVLLLPRCAAIGSASEPDRKRLSSLSCL